MPTEVECDSNVLMAERIVQEFTDHLVADGKSPKNIDSYVGDVDGFLQWLREKDLTFTGDLKRFYITTYRDYLLKNNYKVNTINKKINSLQSFTHFLQQQGYTNQQVMNLRKDKVKYIS